jgi:hypothetical protein
MWLCAIGYNDFFPFFFLVSRCKKGNKLARNKITQVPFLELWISQVGLDPFKSIGRSKVTSIGLDSFIIIFEFKGDSTLWWRFKIVVTLYCF